MKKILAIFISIVLAFGMCACGQQKKSTAAAKTLPTIIDTTEYVLYQNIFMNEMGSDYEGKAVTKKGTFTTIRDEFNNVTRYYVWGYNDQTKCCDWQWELHFKETPKLPANGSLVEAVGTFTADEKSLDGYWIDDAKLTVKTEYNGPECDVDLTSMGGTLERVQLINIQQHPEKFEGNNIYVYGRVYSPTSIQHPYYDNTWTQEFSTTDTTPATGTVVIVSGILKNGIITESKVSETNQY